MRTKQTVMIIGRPNVGKSTLFNRLIGKRKAIVLDRPGVTVDTNRAVARHAPFICADTVGFSTGEQFPQTDSGLSIVLFDAVSGLTPDDQTLVELVRKRQQPAIYVVNKVDPNDDQQLAIGPFYRLGIEPLAISARYNRGIDQLFAQITDYLQLETVETAEQLTKSTAIRVTLLGRQNAGKSLLLNKIASETIAKVSAQAGTTRDSIDWDYRFNSRSYTMTDTAGLRHKARHSRDKVEFLSIDRTMQALKMSDIVIVVIDITQGIVQQDLRIISLALQRYCPTLVVLNKWDLIDRSQPKIYDNIRRAIIELAIPWASYVPIVVSSALTNYRVSSVKQWIERLTIESQKRVPTAKLNQTFAQITAAHRPPIREGRRINFYYVTQAEIQPPTFVIKCNAPNAIEAPYNRYLVKGLRRELGFGCLPVKVLYRR